MKEEILNLKLLNPKWGYKKIASILGCAQSTVKYHLDPKAKIASRQRQQKLRKNRHPLKKKLEIFVRHYFQANPNQRLTEGFPIISLEDALIKFGDNPVCYLTGEPIDLLKSSTYSLDHIIPIARGGKPTLENMGLTTYQANIHKNKFTPEELESFCKQILEHRGYKITK